MEAVAAEARPAAVPAYEEALDWGYEEPEEEEVSPQQPVDSKVQETANGAVNNEEVVENGGDVAENGEPEEPIKSLWFVRVPRPDNDDRSVELAQQEFDMHLATCRLLNENRRLKKLEKSDARNNTFKQLEILKVANENVKQKRNELAPMRTANLQKRTARSALLESKRQLEATSEAELDEMMKKVEYELQHETLSLKEEKEHIAQLKRLKQQRPKVQTYAMQTRDFETKNDTNEVVKGDQDQLERELKIFREEQAECERVFVELKAVEAELAKELNEMNEEYDVAMQAKNRAFEKLKGAKDERRSRNADFGENRDFSRRVRGLVASGDIGSAHDMCIQQSDRMMDKLKKDKEYREEYMRLWETQRKPPISFMVDEVSVDKSKPKANPKSKGFTSMYDGLKVEPGQSPAEAFVARMMKESNGEAPARPAAVSTPPEPVKKAPKNNKTEDQPKQSTDAPKKKASKSKSDAKIKEVENDFELPDVIVREVLNKKPEDKKVAPRSPKKEVGNVKDQRKEKAAQRRLKKREERKQKETEEKAAKKLADQESREKELKAMQAKALAAEKVQETKEEEEIQSVRTRAAVIPDPVIRGTKKMGGRPRPKPKNTSQSLSALAEKYMVHLCAAGVGILLIMVALYMQTA